ncbi:MAG: RNA polymerase subunit sigma-24 [Verrucomicrobia bacterium]|nr:MAG: RNA polymerase subunit sigma-24 [Verrucomicrobiota bacterium]
MDDSNASALVQAALQHDDEAARALVRRLYPTVAKIVRAHRTRRTAEEDLCQMIFIRVFQKLSQFSGKVPLEHWVSRIAVNTCLNQIESERIRPEVRHADLSTEEQAVIENLATTSEELAPDQRFASRQLVDHLLAALKPVERLAIDLLYLQGRSVEEIRKITGWSAALIKVRAFRARQKMKQQLAKISAREKQ